MEMSVGNAAKELRSKLVVGAECPVCGQRVGQLLADEHFQSVLEPVRVRKVNAEERLRKAATTLAVTQKEVAQQSGEIDRTTKKLEKARADYASMVEKASTACRDAETSVDIDAVNNALAVVAGKLREAAQAQAECDTQRRRFDDTNKLLAATKDAIAKSQPGCRNVVRHLPMPTRRRRNLKPHSLNFSQLILKSEKPRL